MDSSWLTIANETIARWRKRGNDSCAQQPKLWIAAMRLPQGRPIVVDFAMKDHALPVARCGEKIAKAIGGRSHRCLV